MSLQRPLHLLRLTAAAPLALAALTGLPAHPSAAVATSSPHLSAGPLNLKLVWSKDMPGVQFRASSPTVASLDSAGPAMVVGALNGKVYAFHLADGSAVAGWPAQLDKPIDSSPAVATINGQPEVFIGTGTYDSGTGGGYWGLSSTGGTRLHYSGSDPNQASEPVYATPALANITCGGGTDVVAGALGQDSYSLDAATGSVLPGWPLFTYDTVFSSPSIAQVGGQTLVFEGGDQTTPHGGILRAVNGAGRVVWSDQFDDVVTSSPAVGDLGGNGQPMLAVGTGFYWAQQGLPTVDSTKLFVINPADGSVAWSRDLGGYTRTSPALGDLEGNGRTDVVEAVQGNAADPNFGQIWAFDGSGNPLPGWPVLTPPGVGAVIGSVVTADLTGAGYDDVLVPTGDGLYIYDGRSGALAASVAVNQIGMQSSPLVSMDPNGTLGITIAGVNTTTHDGVIFHYEVAGGSIGSSSWPMFRDNPARTGTQAGTFAPAAVASGCGAAQMSEYRFVAADGGIFDFGKAAFEGSAGGTALGGPIVGMAATPDEKGYWLAGQNGAVYPYGDAGNFGSAVGRGIKVVGMAATPDGHGYWLVDQYGGVYCFGTARFFGSTGALRLARPIVGMATTPDGAGYWLVASDGGIFSFGDAAFYGSTGSERLAQPIVGMTATPDGHGYWFVASDGGVFSFGDAAFFGSAGAERLAKPVVGMAATPDGRGYWLVASDGGIFSYGDAPFLGSTGAERLAQPIVGMAS